jgi:diguanylate cyclase (GGDEF)-like protein/PAS domain S-box-containing protein
MHESSPKSPLAQHQQSIVQQALSDWELHKALLDELETGIYIVDLDRRILYWNGGAERITGYLAHEVAGQLCHGDLLMHCDAEGGVLCGRRCPLLHVMADSKPRECTVFLRHRHGHRLPVHVRSRAIHDADGQIIGAVETFEELQAPARQAIRELHAFGCLDELTGAANRRYGEMRVCQALEALNQFGIPFGWLRIGLDSIPALEHRYGHGLIDASMRMIFGTLDGNLGSLDILTRWAKAEFRVEVHYSSRLELAETAEKLVTLVRVSALEWWGDRLRLSVSIGGGTAEHGDTLQSLEARVAGVFESCQASGGDRAAVAHPNARERIPCLP